jgi:mannose/fructose/sorbose-specific phosphotransferase system IIB component
MDIVLVRIDDRLIHGQVVEGWLKAIGANHIVVLSDEVAADKMQQILLSMAVPRNIKVTNFAVEEGAKKLQEAGFGGKERILLLLSRPADVLRLLNYGMKLASVNVGGMHFSQGKKQILRNVSVDEGDLKSLKAIADLGVTLEGRVLPADEMINVSEVVNNEIKKEAIQDK